MPLTKDDLNQIKEVLSPLFGKINQDIEDLARLTKRGFDDVYKRFETMDKRLSKVEDNTTVIKDIVKDHDFSIARLEHHTGIGKS